MILASEASDGNFWISDVLRDGSDDIASALISCNAPFWNWTQRPFCSKLDIREETPSVSMRGP